jgi:hypothetical protein
VRRSLLALAATLAAACAGASHPARAPGASGPSRPARAPAPDAPGASPLSRLRAEAHARSLADTAAWRALGHYHPGPLGRGVESLADDPGFFLAEDGSTDPAAELDATLAAFFASAPTRVRQGEHPQCAFPARFAWLDAELGFEAAGLARQPCPELERWRADLGPAQGVSLIFPEAYMNNPASMFGHTLLRIDRAPPEVDAERRDLLAYAVNFAAETGDDGGALFAVKGLTGVYPGYFTLWPYYEKVKQYGDWESRDIWEYRLVLGPEEVERLLLHVYELRRVRFDYWFFDENCSYELLGLLEVVRPGAELQRRFRGWAIPIDTVRAVLAETGLAREATFRPSAATRIAHAARGMAPAERRLARELARGERAPDDPAVAALPEPARAAVLTLAYDLVRRGARAENAELDRPRSLALLRARSRLDVRGEAAPPPPTPAVAPDHGHETARLRLGAGARDGEAFLEARVRPAFHDLLDPLGGYTRGAQIDFLELAVRVEPGAGDVELHELTLVDIVSLAPRDALFRPISWRVGTGLESRLRPHRGELRDAPFWRSGGGAGLAASPLPHLIVYGFAEARADVAAALDPAVSVGPGASAGVLVGSPGDLWRTHLSARAARYVLGDARTALALALEQRLRLGRNVALELAVTGERDFARSWLEAGLFLRRYF